MGTSKFNKNLWFSDILNTWRLRKNIILYGAPGTGKTYNIPELAVRMCENECNSCDMSHKDIMEKYIKLKKEGRIVFTTFHQSMDYENWIEGLKPVAKNNQITYNVENGIFKKLCIDAGKAAPQKEGSFDIDKIDDNSNIWKASLGGVNENFGKDYCLNNNCICNLNNEKWEYFKKNVKLGDIIYAKSKEHTHIQAIGIITGNVDNIDNVEFCKVKWLVKEEINYYITGAQMPCKLYSSLHRKNKKTEEINWLKDFYLKNKTEEIKQTPYIIIIDELNRGNVSNIFGETITLLEGDKRKGRENEESIVLPYSKESFVIPDNVYIIATMNTADKSLCSLDFAIKRRFAFIPTKPYELNIEGFNKEIFRKVSELFISNYDEYKESGWNQTIKLQPSETLSSEYKPEDVSIGHSYFIFKDENGNDNTSNRILYEIIPLIEDYIRDGVLTENAVETIDYLYQKATK